MVVLLSLLFAFQAIRNPHIRSVHYLYNGTKGETSSLPLLLKVSGTGTLSVWFNLDITESQGTIFTLQIDDCARKLWINGRKVTRPPCNNNRAVDRDLKPYLIAGSNSVRVLIQDVRKGEIGLDLSLSTHAPAIRWPAFAAMIVILLYAVSLFHATLGRKNPLLTALFAGGGLLRLLYVTVTPFNVRGHDVSSHIDYIRFIATHFQLPPTTGGFEFHQAPLYYLLMSPLLAIPKKLGISFTLGLSWIQCASLSLSIGTLFVAYWIGTLLFRRKKERLSLILFSLLTATFPALVLFAPRINNDVLFQFIAFLFLGLLLRWWTSGTERSALLVSAVIGIGILTKSTAYLFLPIFLISVLFRPGTSTRQKLRWVALSVAIPAFLAGWFLLHHYLRGDLAGFVRFGGVLHGRLKIPTSWQSFLVINPFYPTSPFANAWSDDGGRQYFWIYFFKTALLGEFSYPGILLPLSRLLLSLGIGMVALLILSIFRTLRLRDPLAVPMFLAFVFTLAGAFAYRILRPASSNQDFRFSILLVPVFAYFIARALPSFSPILRDAAVFWSSLFVFMSATFFVTLFLTSL